MHRLALLPVVSLSLVCLASGCADDGQVDTGGETNAETSATQSEATSEESGDSQTTGDGDGDPATGDGDGDPTGDGDGDPTGDGDGDPTGDGDGDATGDGDGEPEEAGTISFVAFGDQGEGNDAQFAVAAAAEVICEERGCDFALLLGDNFYDIGVDAVDDIQFIDKFEMPYADLDMPFYITLGNHDYGETSAEWWRGQPQLDYAMANPKWVFPKEWFSFSEVAGSTTVDVFAFDSSQLMWGRNYDEQSEWISDAVANSTATWKIAFAHHPYISNGQHGNAGCYEGFPAVPILSGGDVKSFMDDHVCGTMDAYISGHDHNRQIFKTPVCDTYFFLSGASAKTTDLENHYPNLLCNDENPDVWQDDTREGFLYVTITGNEMTVAMYDLDGELDYEQVINK